MINYLFRIVNYSKRGLTLKRKNAQQTLFPFTGIFEEIIAVDYPYPFTKTLPKKGQEECRQNRCDR